jgi:hypothetical protein
MKCIAAIAVLALLTSCSSFRETHYFRSEDARTGKPVNYFRVTVDGSSFWTKSRYISGYYDERAVDLFFNETKSDNSDDVKKIFVAEQTAPGATDKIIPLAPQQNGAFLMIFSTNAKAVTDALGQFAESQVVADAVTNIINRGQIREARKAAAASTTDTARTQALAANISSLLSDTSLPAAASAADAQTQTLRVLRAIATALGGDGQFASADNAEAWFAAKRTVTKGGM